VISIIVYGRNDAHGYNLHRRATLSLNCLAEVLTDPDDEIVFVDYNTPDELPTLVEAFSDTLTERCLGLLRVLRVRAAVHAQRFAAHSHLPAIEPVARNAAARQANPSNRWLLSTNTDMILLPRSDQSLSEICSDLADGYYGLPRFELPEWLWEHLPRSDPSSAMAEVERLGPSLRLDEPTVSHEWMRFDAPGDFQLILREDYMAIDGFDEAMLLGWHVDANLSRRMFIHRGSIESLEEHVAAYHCNHNRTPTVYHRAEWIANDMDRFFHSVDQAEVPEQRETWGLADTSLEEVPVRQRIGPHFANSVVGATAEGPVSRGVSDSRKAKFGLEYDSRHVLPFIADSLSVAPPDARIGYIGANPVLEQMLAALVASLGLGGPLARAEFEDLRSVGELDRISDVLVVDLGIDASLLGAPLDTATGPEFARYRAELGRAFNTFQRLVGLERTHLEQGEHPRRFVLVNSSAAFWNAYVLAHLHCSPTTTHSRVRNAIVKLLPEDDDAARVTLVRAQRLFRWIVRRDTGPRRFHVHLGKTVELADLDDYGGFEDGWAHPDKTAVWTKGLRSQLSLTLDEPCETSCLLTLGFEKIGICSDDSLRVELLANGALVAARDFSEARKPGDPQRGSGSARDAFRPTIRRLAAKLVRQMRALGIPGVDAAVGLGRRMVTGSAQDSKHAWSIALPANVLVDGRVDLTLVVQEPVRWSDDRRHGLRLRSFTVGKRGWRQRLNTFHPASQTKVGKDSG
jgi:hypothetical protein